MYSYLKKYLTLILLCAISHQVMSQIYGTEVIVNGNFGTTADGVNTTKNIYPINEIEQQHIIDPYYQPIKQVYHNNNLVFVDINPTVTVGVPLLGITEDATNYETAYTWGFTEPWETTYYTYPKTDGTNS